MTPIIEEKIKNIEDQFEDKEFDLSLSPVVSPKQVNFELAENLVKSPDDKSTLGSNIEA